MALYPVNASKPAARHPRSVPDQDGMRWQTAPERPATLAESSAPPPPVFGPLFDNDDPLGLAYRRANSVEVEWRQTAHVYDLHVDSLGGQFQAAFSA